MFLRSLLRLYNVQRGVGANLVDGCRLSEVHTSEAETEAMIIKKDPAR
jgi:hypothetical protein